jgi:hypothetical protein
MATPWRYRWAAAAGSSPSPPAETQFKVTTVVRAMSGSVKTSRSSRLCVENSETMAPAGPAWNQRSVLGGTRCCSPGRRTTSCQTVYAPRSALAGRQLGRSAGGPSR